MLRGLALRASDFRCGATAVAIHYRTKGIILKKEERGEADFLFTIYTKDFGKLDILGKAIRKIKSKLRAGARDFCLSEIEFIQGKTYKTLTDAILIEEFKNLKTDLRKLKITYEITKILDNLVSGQEKDENIWNLLIETFQRLNSSQLSIINCQLLYYYVFLYNLFSFLGYQPQLYNCVLCGKKLEIEKLYWSPEEGGVVCKKCFNNIDEKSKLQKIDVEIIKILRLLLQKDWQTISKLKLSPIHLEKLKSISDDYLLHISGNIHPN